MKHGGDLTDAKARHGGHEPEWLDLSTGINPHAWPVPDGLAQAGWHRLPDSRDEARLSDAARIAYRVPDGVALVAAPGTQALIQWLPRLAPMGDVAVLGPTYGEHETAWRAVGADVRIVRRLADADEARHVVVVSPNNPDGRAIDHDALGNMARRRQERGGWLVVDQSFTDVTTDGEASALPLDGPAIILRSFGKFYGLAGLRLGFALAPPPIAARIAEALGPWAVSGPALAIGAAALADRPWADAMRIRLATEADALDRVLGAAGLALVGGTGLYRLVRHPEARAIHEMLAAAHIWVRSFDWAPDLLRFGLPPDAAARDRLRAALGRAVG